MEEEQKNETIQKTKIKKTVEEIRKAMKEKEEKAKKSYMLMVQKRKKFELNTKMNPLISLIKSNISILTDEDVKELKDLWQKKIEEIKARKEHN